jgi:hypothetical protein
MKTYRATHQLHTSPISMSRANWCSVTLNQYGSFEHTALTDGFFSCFVYKKGAVMRICGDPRSRCRQAMPLGRRANRGATEIKTVVPFAPVLSYKYSHVKKTFTTTHFSYTATLSPYNPFLMTGCTVNYQDAPPRGQTLNTRPERPFFVTPHITDSVFFFFNTGYMVKDENRGVQHWCAALPLSLQNESKKYRLLHLCIPLPGLWCTTLRTRFRIIKQGRWFPISPSLPALEKGRSV